MFATLFGVDLDVVRRDSAVLFELGDQYAAHHLCETLWCRWDALIHHGDAATVVAVALPQTTRDVGDLLNAVEDWLDRRDVPLIRFHLDSRLYVLQRGGQIAPAGPARACGAEMTHVDQAPACAPPAHSLVSGLPRWV